MKREHLYNISLKWTGNTGYGTKDYTSYNRNFMISSESKDKIEFSSDPLFRGDRTKYNPEELLLSSVSGCHLLWFLHLCSESKILVVDYEDNPVAKMIENSDGGGKFTEIILNPIVTINSLNNVELIDELHLKAGKLCFIANSLNFPVKYNSKVIVL